MSQMVDRRAVLVVRSELVVVLIVSGVVEAVEFVSS